MSYISDEQSKIISTKDTYSVVPLCCDDKHSPLYHNDSILRYIGFRKKTIIYNNSNVNIIICIKPGPSSFITKYACKNIEINCIPTGQIPPTKIILQPKTLKKIILPTRFFFLTIGVKIGVEINNIEYSDQNEENNNFDIINNIRNFFIEARREIIKSVRSNKNWKILYEDRPFDSSCDIYINNNHIKDIQDMPEVTYDSI
tara:strand:+ start:49 stop:651 length:603 start_codon:yes stop_codon:yes gene_type:complete